jgi:hypothetical protein
VLKFISDALITLALIVLWPGLLMLRRKGRS